MNIYVAVGILIVTGLFLAWPCIKKDDFKKKEREWHEKHFDD